VAGFPKETEDAAQRPSYLTSDPGRTPAGLAASQAHSGDVRPRHPCFRCATIGRAHGAVSATSTAPDDGKSCSLIGADDDGIVVEERNNEEDTMIEGLKLAFPGAKLRELMDERILWHEGRIAHFTRELARRDTEGADQAAIVPTHMLEHERDDHLDRLHVLVLIREHLDATETYRLAESDLRLADLIPDTVCW
jgi:hypothetical protein